MRGANGIYWGGDEQFQTFLILALAKVETQLHVPAVLPPERFWLELGSYWEEISPVLEGKSSQFATATLNELFRLY